MVALEEEGAMEVEGEEEEVALQVEGEAEEEVLAEVFNFKDKRKIILWETTELINGNKSS